MSSAKWIWRRGDAQANTWMCFARDFVCDHPSGPWILRIAADTKYWLSVNGKTVLREGGLKRGRSPRATYCDEVDIGGFLRPGTNRVAILVWYFGKDGFSHLSSGHGGLYVETVSTVVGGLVSDENWKVRRNDAFLQQPEGEEGPNFRLPESDIHYDASRAPGPWTDGGFDLSDWEDAEPLGEDEMAAFGALVERPIPLFRFSELTDFVNSGKVRGLHIERDTTLVMRLPSNLQFTPYLQIEAPRGKRIVIDTESYATANAPDVNGLKCVYWTKDGPQAYESPGWMNGETARFRLPAGITVRALRYRRTAYAVDRAGYFRCDDPFLNRLWEKCYRTLHLCMRDTFMDCPNRERAQWWGDADIEAQMALYCMDERANALYENGVYTMVEWYEATGMMLTVVPCGNARFELPFQNLAGIRGFVRYYRHTGRLALLERAYPMAKDYVSRYALDAQGLAIHRAGSWDWPDWGDNADIAVMENAWLCLALDACGDMAALLNKPEDARAFRAKAETVRRAARSAFAVGGAFYHRTDNGRLDDRANALALLAGFCDEKNSDGVAKVLETVENASPYMEKTVLEALCESGRTEAAMTRMKRRYAAMVGDDYSTLWELWTKEASLNHGWSGGPLIILSRYVAGIRPEGDGSRWIVAPNPCGLKHIECAAPTRYGPLTVRIDREDGANRLEIIHPGELTVEAATPTGEEGEAWTVISRSL